jgi:excisionase family DNA binding protein
MVKKNKEIMTTQDVAEYLNVHPLTVHKYARQGKIPAFKIGTDWRYHKKYIEEWIKEKLEYNVTGKDRRKSAVNQEVSREIKEEKPENTIVERKERRKTVLKELPDSA